MIDGVSILDSRLHTRDEVFARPSPVPKSPGSYGWWFLKIPGAIDTSGCEQREGLTLLYTGISPTRPPANGRPPSSQSLNHRIRYHYNGNAEGSTLRKTLGILLADDIGTVLRRTGSGQRRTFCTDGERALTQWMSDNALVSWVVHPEPWELEEAVIATLDVPLNIQGNAHNHFYPELRRLRAEAEQRARNIPPCV